MTGTCRCARPRLEVRRAKRGAGLRRRQRLDAAKVAFDGAGADLGLIDFPGRLVEFGFHFFQDAAEFAEFRLHGAQDLPNFRGPLLNGQRPETHLKAVQQRGEGGVPDDDNAVIPLQGVHQSGAAPSPRQSVPHLSEPARALGAVQKSGQFLPETLQHIRFGLAFPNDKMTPAHLVKRLKRKPVAFPVAFDFT